MQDAAEGDVVLRPMQQPALLDSGAPPSSHLAVTPDKHLLLYDDVQWEEFVLEWATSLTSKYKQVMRSGGANDHGVDVAGFDSDQGFEGRWDCYQCKHYSSSLTPSNAYPEILKIILGVIAGHYTWPRRYRFVAPRGYGTTLANLIHSPSNLKNSLKHELTKGKSVLAKQLGNVQLEDVLEYIEQTDFSVFGTVELHELVEQHSYTRWHSARFAVALPARPEAPQPTAELATHEQRYVEKLIAAYNERHSNSSITSTNAAEHEKVGKHYFRQRVSFYSAEALRLFARDSVPEGTFDSLQNEIHDGVIDIHELEHKDGMERLHKVAESARFLSIAANVLLPVLAVRDRTGICHQLANEDRLTWCHAGTE